MFDLEKIKKIYFVGIGGIGMSALARYFVSIDKEVLGSDQGDSELLDDLKKEGIKVNLGHKKGNVPEDTDLIVYTEAIPKDNPELDFEDIPKRTYAQVLGEISKKYKTIAVAGAHGKSTTTAMMGLAMEDATVFVGTKIFEWGKKNFKKGNSDFLVLEACEYRNSFLNIKPYVAVITSIEHEHLDFFKTKEDYLQAFEKFINRAEILVADLSDENVLKVAKNFKGKIINSADFLDEVPKLRLLGEHNRSNSSKVLGVFSALGFDLEIAKRSLENFRGTWRRFEKKAERVYDDYGHHPTEIKATLGALREKFPKSRIVCVFQPHQFSRTRFFLDDFGKSFGNVDEVLMPNIYQVRDSKEDVESVSAEDLVKKIEENGVRARYTKDFETTVEILKNEIKNDDVLITMGAGNVDEVGEKFISRK